ncbi:MAG: 4'-phosphopantetheinyl transferase superfamily protein [Cyanobacteriota bacterium]|nr:4'-phosphopantetheinyl transferase superfamily protein [Cyanobacteriota bacterium]
MNASAGVLAPRPWRLGDPPPPPPPTAAPPLLLLIDRRALGPSSPRADPLATLTAEERQRHAAFRRSADQERFLLGRAGLRQVLGHWLGRHPGTVPLETGVHGKPHCPEGPAFNLSHSGDLILLAFHRVGAVGVDVERLRSDLDWRSIARRVFPPARVAALEELAAGERAAAFLRDWCRLEARLKARGEGLAGLERPSRHEAVAREDAAAGLPPGGRESGREILWDVQVPPGYAAALVLATPLMDPPAVAAGGDHPSPPE